jgi:hypothetical protein
MNHLFFRLLFLWVGNACKWIYHGGNKTIDEVSIEDNYILGLLVSIVLGTIMYLLYS